MNNRVRYRFLGIDGDDWVKLGLACSLGLNVAFFGVIALNIEPFRSYSSQIAGYAGSPDVEETSGPDLHLHSEGLIKDPEDIPGGTIAEKPVLTGLAAVSAPIPRPAIKDQARIAASHAVSHNVRPSRISDAFLHAGDHQSGAIDLSGTEGQAGRVEALKIALRDFRSASFDAGGDSVLLSRETFLSARAPLSAQTGPRPVKVEPITAASLPPVNKRSAERIASFEKSAPRVPGEPAASAQASADLPEAEGNASRTLAFAPSRESTGETVRKADEATRPALEADAVPSINSAGEPAGETPAPVRVAALQTGDTLTDAVDAYPGAPVSGSPSVSVEDGSGGFFTALRDLKTGLRTKPVTIVHIGDSHVASDSFSQGIRRGLQAEFGDAGRGMLIPAGAFKYGTAAGVKMKKSGSWNAATSHRTKSGPYGLSGVRLSSQSTSAALTISPNSGKFDWAEVTVVTGPKQGKVKITVGDRSETYNARSTSVGSKVVRLAVAGDKATVKPAGGGTTTVLSWAIGNERPGIRYVNFGLIGATASVTKRWSETLVRNDLKHLDPDLIVWGFGTNEGFNDNLSLSSYRKTVEAFLALASDAAPKAEVLFIGPASSARLPRFAGRSSGSCRVLTAEQQKNYSGLLKKRSRALASWHEPPKLNALRALFEELAADHDGYYWDWSEAMGGACSIDRWARSSPKMAAGDRVHLQMRGYKKSAEDLVEYLTGRVEKLEVASAQ